CATLAGDQHGRDAVGSLADRLEDVEHLRALAEEVLEAALPPQLAFESLVLVLEPFPLERVGDGQLDLVDLEGLRQVVVGAELHRLDGRLGGGERGDHEDHRLGRLLLGGAQHRESVHLPHAEVGDDEVERVALPRLDRGFAAVAHTSSFWPGTAVAPTLSSPPWGIASTAFRQRFQSTCRNCSGSTRQTRGEENARTILRPLAAPRCSSRRRTPSSAPATFTAWKASGAGRAYSRK